MNDILKIDDVEILVSYFEGFGDRATITMPVKNNYSFEKIVDFFKEKDISSLKFYKRNIENDENVDSLIGELSGYTKITGYTSNLESDLSTINLEKPSLKNMSLEEIKKYILGDE